MSDMTTNADSVQRWAALDSRNERLVDASHPLLAAQLLAAQCRKDTQAPTAKAS